MIQEELVIKMGISENLKTIDNKIKRQTAKISALSSVNVNNYDFLTSKDVLAKKKTCQKKLLQ